ncbi:MAG: hypothetical protein QXX68_00955 [Candidatus Pacearchaeota archaeon]
MNHKFRLIKTAIAKGKLLQELFPEMGSFYLAKLVINDEEFPMHFSIRDIAEICLNDDILMERVNIRNRGLLESAIKYALYGNKNCLLGEVYNGLLSEEEYSLRSRQNRVNSAFNTYQSAIENKKGALFQSKEKLTEAAKKAAISRGQRPWTAEEISLAYSLKDSGYNATEIGQELGRTRYAVLEMFRRESRKKERKN